MGFKSLFHDIFNFGNGSSYLRTQCTLVNRGLNEPTREATLASL